MYCVDCWIEHANAKIDHPFSYGTDNPDIKKGMRVWVDFGPKKVVGFVEQVSLEDHDEATWESIKGVKLKPIRGLIDEEPLLTDELFDCAKWMAYTTVSPTIACFQTLLPEALKPRSGSGHVVLERWVSVSDQEQPLTAKQVQCVQRVIQNQTMRYTELRKEFPSIAPTLLKKGVLVETQKEREAQFVALDHVSQPFVLTPEQKKAYDTILEGEERVYLLHGVTGSGKTEVYLQLAQEVLSEGKQVLILVPEIGLTPQMVERVKSRFGAQVAIYHSSLNNQEKYEQYQSVKNHQVQIVVGTRSACFMPFDSLGLVVMDEEHDGSYKQDNVPRYHTRDVILHRAEVFGSKVILGSATPSLETYARALKNVYTLVPLGKRINETLPEIQTIPLHAQVKEKESYILTKPLREALGETLAAKEQAILLLNRRGYTSVLRCEQCEEPLTCPHCDMALSYHADTKRMQCHLCGYEMNVPKICPHCGKSTRFSSFGFGTQRVEEELKKAFPEARIIRMDADSTRRKGMHQVLFDAFEKREADILLGTQMIAKGLDFPAVTLVGILNADAGLSRTDFRSPEITFDLIMQAAGRSGRSEKKGKVLLQVFDPDSYVVEAACQNNYEAFFRKEMQFRHAGSYPPYSYFVSFYLKGTNEKVCRDRAEDLRDFFQGKVHVLGPSALLKIQDQIRYRVLLQGKNLDELIALAHEGVNYLQNKEGRFSLSVDVNPTSLE